jgi:hypothetical protein
VQLFGRVAVLVCVLVSAVLAGRFGWTRGASDIDRSIYGSAAVALDLLKPCLPLLAVISWHAGKVPQAIVAWFAFLWLTGFSLLCASGLTATQLAEKLSLKSAASTAYEAHKAEFERLVLQRGWLPQVTPADEGAEAAARAAAEQVDASVKAECEKRGPLCRDLEKAARDRHDELARITSAVAVTKAASQLDDKIAAAKAALDAVDLQAVNKEADPQASDIAQLTGYAKESVAAFLHLVLAISIEIGSGLGVWIAFGHGRTKHEAFDDGRRDEAISLASLPSEPLIESPGDLLRRFADEALHPAKGIRVSASELFALYERWCEREGTEPVSQAAFGTRMGTMLTKQRKGGRFWYLDVGLGPKPPPIAASPARSVLGRMATARKREPAIANERLA